ncbi:MAG: hypothetical protein RLZZ28_920, partial [Bacteroidota bacterium]
MSKRRPNPATGQEKKNIQVQPMTAKNNWDIPGFIFCLGYLLIHFVPILQSIDIMGPQWLYL